MLVPPQTAGLRFYCINVSGFAGRNIEGENILRMVIPYHPPTQNKNDGGDTALCEWAP
jgi:hypothetical protein